MSERSIGDYLGEQLFRSAIRQERQDQQDRVFAHLATVGADARVDLGNGDSMLLADWLAIQAQEARLDIWSGEELPFEADKRVATPLAVIGGDV